MKVVVLVVLCYSLQGSVCLDEADLVGDGNLLRLDGEDWKVACFGDECECCSSPLQARVPGDLISDLERAHVLGDANYELNFRTEARIWANGNWTYWKEFIAPNQSKALLVFDGIKMGATIRVNGEVKETAKDQFLRYVIPLEGNGRAYNLSVAFEKEINEDGRFMACGGGWDWSPYTRQNKGNAHIMGKGIWNSVYVVGSSSGAFISDLVPEIRLQHQQMLVATPLCDLNEQEENCYKLWEFDVGFRVYFVTLNPGTTRFSLTVPWSSNETFELFEAKEEGLVEHVLDIKPNEAQVSAAQVDLWWPNGLGSQPLYSVKVCLNDTSSGACSERKIGFRSVTLTTGNDEDPEYRQKHAFTQGTDTLGMVFRANGRTIYARGSNTIPMDDMEGRFTAKAHWRLVKSAIDAHFNLVRIWGGGIFLPKAFYDACDELGLLVHQDMMYAQRGHEPKRTKTQERELRHQVRRLAHHPSIILYNSCNECAVIPLTPSMIYADFVLKIVVEEDPTRIVWPTSPSFGWLRGVNRLTSIPVSRDAMLIPRILAWRQFDSHGPYQHGTGFPSINGISKEITFQPELPMELVLREKEIGIQHPSLFVSEFGTIVMSSFESIAPTLNASHHALHGGAAPDECTSEIWENNCKGDNVMAERNYPCDSLIRSYFGPRLDFDVVGEEAFRAQLYLCLLSQALNIKTTIEKKRSQNEFGALTWQFNEIWPTGGWGSVEYGAKRPGQVEGGRWKILHHWFEQTIFKDSLISCGWKDMCFVRHDGRDPLVGKTAHVFDISIATGQVVFEEKTNLTSLSTHTIVPLVLHRDSKVNLAEIFRVAQIVDNAGTVHVHNEQIMATPLAILKSNVSWKASLRLFAKVEKSASEDGSFTITLSSETLGEENASKVALYVQLTTLAQGRFSVNGFMYVHNRGLVHCNCHTIKFHSFSPNQGMTLRSSLKIIHMHEAIKSLQKQPNQKSIHLE